MNMIRMLEYEERRNETRYQIPIHTLTGWGRDMIIDMNENGEPLDEEVRARYAECPLRMILCKELEQQREDRLRKMILENGFDQYSYKSNFECFKKLDEDRQDKDRQDIDSEDEDRLWPWRNLSPMEKMYLANELREAGLCKPMKYCRELKYNGPVEYSSAELIYTIKDINENEVVITNEQMEMQWTKELIGDFMRVELEEPEWRDDNLNKELMCKLDTKMVEKVIKAHHFMRRVHKKIMNEDDNCA